MIQPYPEILDYLEKGREIKHRTYGIGYVLDTRPGQPSMLVVFGIHDPAPTTEMALKRDIIEVGADWTSLYRIGYDRRQK